MERLSTHIKIDKAIYRISAFSLTLKRLSAIGLLATASLASISSWALEFRCEAPGDIRYLRVDIPGEERLCEVSVKYEYTEERRVMWHADNDTLFCSAKAYELRDKYENQWSFNCTIWPDRDGIDNLSPSNRAILDGQLKSIIAQGRTSNDPFEVSAVRATASTPLDNEPGTLALQYFLSTGDITQIILSEGDDWELFATIDNLADQVISDAPVSSALIQTITDGGSLEVSTTVPDGIGRSCYGNQVLMVQADNQLTARTPHRFICSSDDQDSRNGG